MLVLTFTISLLKAHSKTLLSTVGFFVTMILDSRNNPAPVELGDSFGTEIWLCMCSHAVAHGHC